MSESIHHHNDYLWGETVWLITSRITASFTRCHWPTEFTEMDNGQFEGLPAYTVSTPGSQEIQIPLEAMLSAQLAEDLAESGFTVLICKPNRDSAYLLCHRCCTRPSAMMMKPRLPPAKR